MKTSFAFSLLGKSVILSFSYLSTPKERTFGKSSRIPNSHNHVLFFDYDTETDEEILIDEQRSLMEEFRYGNTHLFKLDRPHSYHAVCIDYFTLHEAKTIIQASSCDVSFLIAPRYDKFRSWILRDFKKGERGIPVYYKTLTSPYEGIRKQSLAHANYLNLMYPEAKITLTNSDDKKDILVESYNTANRTQLR